MDASGHVAGSSPCGLGLHLREPWTHWWRCGRLDLGKSGRHRGRGRSRRDPSRLCGDPRRERGGGPAHSGLGLGVSVGTTKRRDYGGRRLARGSLGGARCWRRPGDSPGCGWISHRCVCRGGRASVNCTSNSNWSLTRDFLALCRPYPRPTPRVHFLSFYSAACPCGEGATWRLLQRRSYLNFLYGCYSNSGLENGSYRTPRHHQKERGRRPPLSTEPQHLLVREVSPAHAWTV